jgi:hypothetical protein
LNNHEGHWHNPLPGNNYHKHFEACVRVVREDAAEKRRCAGSRIGRRRNAQGNRLAQKLIKLLESHVILPKINAQLAVVMA